MTRAGSTPEERRSASLGLTFGEASPTTTDPRPDYSPRPPRWGHLVAAGAIGLLAAGALAVAVRSGGAESDPSPTTTTAEPRPDGSASDEIAGSSTTEPPTSRSSGTTTRPSVEIAERRPSTIELAAAVDNLKALTAADVLVAEVDFDRAEYAWRWDNSDEDCPSERDEVLMAASLIEPELAVDGCRVEFGLWRDPFRPTEHFAADEVVVDHLVPLEAAHRAGGWAWDLETKAAYFGDVAFVPTIVVVGIETASERVDLEPDRWKPPNEAAWCTYAIDWISVKTRWRLAVTDGERDALEDMIRSCRPVAPTADDIAEVPLATPTTSTTTTTILEPVEAGDIRVRACRSRAEEVILENRGPRPVVLVGWTLHDRGRRNVLSLDSVTVPGRGIVRIVSGPGARPDQDTVVWTDQNVWRNDGDTASLRFGGTLVHAIDCL